MMLSFCLYVLEEETVRTVTEWIVTDVNTVEGRELLYNAIKHMVNN